MVDVATGDPALITQTNIEWMVRNYLPLVFHLSLATSASGRPWCTEVHFVADEQLNLYFRSKPSRRHSQDIGSNPYVAGSITTSHGLTDKPLGVYFEGKVRILDTVEVHDEVYRLYSQRFQIGPETLDEARTQDGHRFYMISVTDYYVFDARHSRPSQKYHLPWRATSGS